VQILIGRGDVAAAEPDADDAAGHLHRGVADHLRIPRLVAAEDGAELAPVDAVGGARQAQAAVLGGRARVAQFQNRVGAELLPADAVRGTRDAETLAASAVLATR
jgi:hypothetical protein